MLKGSVVVARESEVMPTDARSLAWRVWGLDWWELLPQGFDDITVEVGVFAKAEPFVKEHYPRIFGDSQGRFLAQPATLAKDRFTQEMDTLLIRERDKLIGICLGHPTDWSTYYVRTLAILPEYREQKVAQRFERILCGGLASANVERVEAECSVANAAMIRLFTTAGWMPAGTIASERWGMTVRFTRILDPRAGEVFRRQYVNISAFGRDPKPA